jgi:hypothetical protein
MAYMPDWYRLPDALRSVMATGIEEDQVKQDICNAIADRKIKIRGLVVKEEGLGSFGRVVGTVRRGGEFEVPPHLCARDFEWDESRPVGPWRESQTHGSDVFAARWHLEWIELFRPDVAAVLCGGRAIPRLAPAPFSTRHWPEPQADWLPISQAVFRFGLAVNGGSSAAYGKPLHECTESEIVESSTQPLSLTELTKMLKEKTNALEVEIDPVKGIFSFSFLTAGGGASCLGGATLGNPEGILE